MQFHAPIAVIFPALSTVATLVSEVVQVTFLFLALSGETVAISVSVPPTVIVSVDRRRDMPGNLARKAASVRRAVNIVAAFPCWTR